MSRFWITLVRLDLLAFGHLPCKVFHYLVYLFLRRAFYSYVTSSGNTRTRTVSHYVNCDLVLRSKFFAQAVDI